MLLLVLLVLIGIAVALLAYLLSLRKSSSLKGCFFRRPDGSISAVPIAPGCLPLIGHAAGLSDVSQYHTFNERLSDQTPHNGAFFIKMMTDEILVVDDDVLIHEMLLRRPRTFSRHPLIYDGQELYRGAQSVFSSEKEWFRHRKLTAPAFTAQSVRQCLPMLQECVRLAEQQLRQQAKSCGSTQPADVSCNLALDIILRFAFGSSLADQAGKTIRDVARELLTITLTRVLSFLPVWKHPLLWRLLPTERRLRLTLEPTMTATLLGLLDNARRNKDSGAAVNFIQKLLSQPADSAEPALTDGEIIANAEAVLIAGHETTAQAMAWGAYFLAKDPSLQQRLREELRREVPGKGWSELTADDLGKLHENSAFVNEVLRLKSPAPFFVLYSLEAADFRCRDGSTLHIEPGAMVTLLTRKAALRNYGANLNLDNWLKAADSARPAHISFGSGPRICPGRALAMLELQLWTAMLGSYQLALPASASEPKEILLFTMAPGPFSVELQPLSS
jgi:cytochrome P450